MQTIEINLSEKQKTFSEFLCAFSESTPNFELLQKMMTVIMYVFSKLRNPKNVVR